MENFSPQVDYIIPPQIPAMNANNEIEKFARIIEDIDKVTNKVEDEDSSSISDQSISIRSADPSVPDKESLLE